MLKLLYAFITQSKKYFSTQWIALDGNTRVFITFFILNNSVKSRRLDKNLLRETHETLFFGSI